MLWKWFEPTDNKNYIKCLICSQEYRTNNASTGPMSQHLKAKHKKQHREFLIASGKAIQEDVSNLHYFKVRILIYIDLRNYI
jgi:hypothetical protein